MLQAKRTFQRLANQFAGMVAAGILSRWLARMNDREGAP
jgi:hypothetical protein